MKRVFRRDDPALDDEPEIEVPGTDDVPADLFEIFSGDVFAADNESTTNDDQEATPDPDSDSDGE